MKYTTRGDGRKRANVIVKMPFSKEELAAFKDDIKLTHGECNNVNDALTSLLYDALFSLQCRADDIRAEAEKDTASIKQNNAPG